MKKFFIALSIITLFIIGCEPSHNEPVQGTAPTVEGQEVSVVVDKDGNIVAAASSVPLQIPEEKITEEITAEDIAPATEVKE